MKAVGKTWHKGCLRCTSCSTLLDSKRLNEKDGEPHCGRCYNKVRHFLRLPSPVNILFSFTVRKEPDMLCWENLAAELRVTFEMYLHAMTLTLMLRSGS